MNESISFEPLTAEHWPAVRSIYLQGIATGNATFQQAPPDWSEWDQAHLQTCRWIAKIGSEVVGWAALAPISTRPVYAGVAEVSIYIAERMRGRGIGKHLLAKLVTDSEAASFWTLQAGIFPENAESVRLHLGAGFRVVGTRIRLGNLNGRWRDVILLEQKRSYGE
jgi:phosphinothricin acetyltransferase